MRRIREKMKANWMSARMLGSYLALLAAPLCAILLFYIYTNRALLSVQYEKSYRLQTEAVGNLEQQLSDVHNLSVYLLQEPEVNRFNQPYESKTEEFWAKYQYAQSAPDYSLFNQIIDHVYILSKESRYIIRIPAVIPTTELGYVTVNQFDKDNYTAQMEVFCAQETYGDLMYMTCEDGRECVTMLHSIKNGKKIDGVIAVTLKDSAVNEALKSCNPCAQSVTAIFDAQGRILRTAAGTSSEIDLSGVDVTALPEGYSQAQIGGVCCVVNLRSSAVQDGWYLTATPRWVLTAQIRPMRAWLFVLSGAAAAISLTLCTLFWRRRRGVVDRCRDLQEQLRVSGRAGRPAGRKDGFWEGTSVIFDCVDGLCTEVLTLRDSLKESEERLERERLEREEQKERPAHAASAQSVRQGEAQKESPEYRQLQEYLMEHYQNPCLNVAMMAADFGVSESKMYKDCRRIFGCTMAEQLERLRMEKACGLLKQGLSVKEVSWACGYCSDSSFRRAFKRVVGVSPTDWAGYRTKCENNVVKM